MKYNIVTIANESYSCFLKIFLLSLFDIVNIDRIDYVFIYDTGLRSSSSLRKILRSNDKIKFIKTNICSNSRKLHDKGWQDSTYYKTHALLRTLQFNRPTILIDCDVIFIHDFFDLINGNYDIGVCRTDQSSFTKYLGSFFIANNITKSKVFIKDWICEMELLNKIPKESPALVNVITTHSASIKIKEFFESQICSLKPQKESLIYHLKSGGPLNTIELRLNQDHILPLINKYNNNSSE